MAWMSPRPPLLLPPARCSRVLPAGRLPAHLEHALYHAVYRLFVGSRIAVIGGIAFGILMTGGAAVAAIRLIARSEPVPVVICICLHADARLCDDASKIARRDRQTRCSDPARDLSGRLGGGAEVAWSARAAGVFAAEDAVHRQLAALPSVSPAAASA